MAHPLRLAVVGPFVPIRGGISHFNGHAADALEERGHVVRRVAFRRLYPDVFFPGRSQFEPGQGPDPDAGLTSTGWLGWRSEGKKLAAWGPDAVIAPYWTPPLAPAIGTVARRSGARVIGLVHNAQPHERIPAGRLLSRWFLDRCDAVLTLSHGVAAQVRAAGFDGPLETTPHPVYDRFPDGPPRAEARAALGVAPDAPLLLFFGLVRAYKGLDVLVEALPELRTSQPGIRLHVAGEWYGKRGPVDQQIERLGLDRAVTIEDAYVDDERVALLFSAADLVVLPYRSGTQSGVLETAARYGVPVVVTDLPGLAEPVRTHGAGAVAAAAEPRSVADAVRQVLGDREQYAKGARAMAEAHGWDPFCRVVESLVARIQEPA